MYYAGCDEGGLPYKYLYCFRVSVHPTRPILRTPLNRAEYNGDVGQSCESSGAFYKMAR